MLARYASWLAGENAFRPHFPLFNVAYAWPSDFPAPATDATETGPMVDVLEKDNSIELHCDVPGAGPEDVSVTLENGVLTIQGRRAISYPNAAVRHAERYQGSFARSFQLGKRYDPDQVSAALKNGVLSVHVAKRAEAAPKKIPVTFGAEAPNKQIGVKEATTPASV